MSRANRHSTRHRFTRVQCIKGGSVCRGYETADDARCRALQAAKGMVLREGVTYDSSGAHPWCKRRALHGRTDQIELVYEGRVIRTTGETLLRNRLRWLRG